MSFPPSDVLSLTPAAPAHKPNGQERTKAPGAVGSGDGAQAVGAPVGLGLPGAVDSAADDDGEAAAEVLGAGAPVVTVIRGDPVVPV
jgi:hypothetical protein